MLEYVTSKRFFIEKEFQCRIQFNDLLNGWARGYIIDMTNGCTIGRMSFHDGNLEFLKWYKPDHIKTLCNSDKIRAQIEAYLYQDRVITDDEYRRSVVTADDLRRKDIKEKLLLRRLSGKDKWRRRIEGRHIFRVLREVLNTCNSC